MIRRGSSTKNNSTAFRGDVKPPCDLTCQIPLFGLIFTGFSIFFLIVLLHDLLRQL